MTVFINFKKKQIFAKWLKDEGTNYHDEVKKWEAHGWMPLLTNITLTWQQVWVGWHQLNRAERLKLEAKILR